MAAAPCDVALMACSAQRRIRRLRCGERDAQLLVAAQTGCFVSATPGLLQLAWGERAGLAPPAAAGAGAAVRGGGAARRRAKGEHCLRTLSGEVKPSSS
mmetsp:Transcript_29888/g.65379  ORF Transcript_29888/g.65379 Transcript_29888/m.65379 type:complete len:99 (+) Transcript_29888:717-1013(+)